MQRGPYDFWYWHRFGDHFVNRLLMDEEHKLFELNKWPVRFLAMRFAAKEATVKAIGTGFRNGIWIRDVGIINNNLGRPLVIYSQRGQAVCERFGIVESHVSLTDDAGLIVAFAIVEKL
jgi:holo-[acyl-carrier protein] synthase